MSHLRKSSKCGEPSFARDYEEWLTTVKEAAFRAGTPLSAELLDMVANDAEEVGHAAEAKALGFNATRLHPDIYMNELLVGMRIIHQVLPAILKKLQIDDFTVDQSDLHIDLGAPRTHADAVSKPLVFAGATAMLAIVALTASWVPAHAATKVDPLDAVRN